MKIILRIIMLTITISLLFSASNNVFDNASAESYESGVGVSFTLNPSISVTVSGDLTIANLTPGDYKDSNSITVTANSNSIAGYSLSSTVGSSTNTSTELRKDGVDTTNKFSSITTNKASLSNFDDSANTWGYSYSTDSGTTWQSGDITGTPATGYNGLPLYTSSSSIKLINSSTSGSSSVLFKIGARTTTNQIAGEYTNVINFIGVANPNPPTFDDLFAAAGKTKYNGYYTMQDMTSTICSNALQDSITNLIDIRDGELYTIAKLKDNNCWMLDNLRLGDNEPITLTNQDTNTIENFILPASGTVCFSDSPCTGTDGTTTGTGYTVPAINTSYKNYIDSNSDKNYGNGSHKYGVYYNFCAASAGDICAASDANNDDADYDICPKNWRMPTGNINGEYASLLNFYNSTATSPNSFQYNLSVPLSGVFNGGIAASQGYESDSWSSTRMDGRKMYVSYVTAGYVSKTSGNIRPNGYVMRCVSNT